MSNFTYNQPSVPATYFEKNPCNSSCSSCSSNNSALPELPSELLGEVFVGYANWGDLAKLSTVQKSWSNVVTESAETSGPRSQWELAIAFLNGDCGLQPSPVKAVRMLKKLSSNNNNDNDDESSTEDVRSMAMKKVAECYLRGEGVEQADAKQAVSWMERAYNEGHDASAAFELGQIYEKGTYDGVDIDPIKAAEWFRKGAEGGHVESMVELALAYELGAGVEQSDQEALDWYTKAADLGDSTAKFAVGEIFEEARGVPQSETEACLWYYDAAKTNGCPDSKQALRRLYSIARIVLPGEVTRILEEVDDDDEETDEQN